MGTAFIGAASSGHGFMDQGVLWARSEAVVPQRAGDTARLLPFVPSCSHRRKDEGAGGGVRV